MMDVNIHGSIAPKSHFRTTLTKPPLNYRAFNFIDFYSVSTSPHLFHEPRIISRFQLQGFLFLLSTSTLLFQLSRNTTACLGVGACLKAYMRALLGRGALHKKVDSIPLLLTSERHTRQSLLAARSVSTIQYPNHIYTKPLQYMTVQHREPSTPNNPPARLLLLFLLLFSHIN